MIKNVGELRKLIENLPDDTPVVVYSYGLEQSGYLPRVSATVEKMSPVTKETYDRFDGTEYEYEAFEPSNDGKDTLRIG